MDLFIWKLCGLFSIVSSSSITRRAAPDAPQYVAVSPSELRPDVPFRVFISNLQTPPLEVSAAIVLDPDPGPLSSASSVLQGGEKKTLILPEFDSSSLHAGSDLWLWVRGRDSSDVVVFSNRTRLQFRPQTQTTLIQTDRGRYKPGERVHIRVLSLRRDLTALHSSKDVHVKDPRGRLLRLWSSVDSVLGVSTVEFNLSRSPPLGEWTISATVQGVSTEKHFLVEHYVLPRFRVEISVPTVVFSKHLLRGDVMGKHYHGGHVSGTVSLTFVHHSHGRRATYHWGTRLIQIIQYFEFMIPHMDYSEERMILLDHYDEEYLEILAQITESGTGLQYNSSVKVEVAKHLYKLSFEGHRRVFQPGTVFDTRLKVQMYDGYRPYHRDLPKVQISVLQEKKQFWHRMGMKNLTREEPSEELSEETSGETSEEPSKETSEETSMELELDVPEDGIISLSIPIKEETQLLTIDASFHKSIASLFVKRSHTSESGSYLQIHGPHGPVQPGDVTLRIWSSFPLDEYHYLVKSRGELVLSGASSAEDLLLNLDSAWSPVASVLVFVVLPQGELVVDRIQLQVQADIRNHVSLTWSSLVLKPHEDAALTVSVTEPHSLVGILVVDKASRDSAHNDITKRQVMKETGKLDEFRGAAAMGDPYTLFTESGLRVMTDAAYHQTSKPPVWAFDAVEMMRPTKAEPPPVQSRTRTHFPETWLWMDLLTGENTVAEVSALTPDSMTTWVASAFVMSPTLGIGFMDAPPAELTVRQSFFLSLNLPPLVVRGEELLLEIFLYNYLPSDVQAEVKVEKSFDLEFLSGSVGDEVRTVKVGHMQVVTVLVPVRVLSVGDVLLSVRARAPGAADHIKRAVHVKAEGRPQSFTESRLLVLQEEAEAEEHISYTFPPNVVPDSCEVWVSSVGDVLGAAMSDLDSLIQRPYGCGEQNMIRFAPMVYVLEYLRSVGETDSATIRRALELMIEGYERQLSFQRGDGSMSAFGNNDHSGSTWLTAFVLRVFLQARPFLAVSPDVLRELVQWLFERTSPDGRFLEPGRVIHSELVGGGDSARSLTAYVVIALLEDQNIWGQTEVLERQAKVASALMFLEESLAEGIKSLYCLSLVTYALTLANSSNANAAVDLLLQNAYPADGAFVWTANAIGHAPPPPRSTDIEALGYLLLALHRLRRSAEGLELLRWLSRQQSGHGGFGSTQDTVVALHALSVYAAMGTQDPRLNVTQTHGNWRTSEFSIDRDTSRVLHRTLRSSCSSSSAAVRAVGRGLLLFQVSVAYNVFPEDHLRRKRSSVPQDELYLNLKTMESLENLVLSACFRLSDWSSVSSTGMAVLEVQLLTGFSLRPDSSFNMELVKKVETDESNGKLILYLDSVTLKLQCVTIPLKQEFKTGLVQDALVKLYDYYETSRKAEGFYSSQLKDRSSCVFCGPSCAACDPHGVGGPYGTTATTGATTTGAKNSTTTATTRATTTAATTTAMTTLLDLYDYFDDYDHDDQDQDHDHDHNSSSFYNHNYYHDYSYHYNHHEYHNTYHQSNHHYDYDYYHHYSHHYYHEYYHHNSSGGDGGCVGVTVVISRGGVLLPLPALLFLLALL